MIVKFQKRRHKPLYKNFIGLKKNVQNRRRLTLLKFKKRKWEKLVLYIERLQMRRKKKFRMYDINRFFLPKFYNSFKRKYEYILHTKKKLKLFYGGLQKRFIKKSVKATFKQKRANIKNFVNFNSFFVSLLERRIDVLLYRSHFALSIRSARQLIAHKHVKVNKVTVNINSYKLQKGDLIEISGTGSKLVEFNIGNSHMWPLPPKYLQINYKTLQMVFKDDIEYQNLSMHFPFWLDLYTILRYYVKIFCSSVVERVAVNHQDVGSNPA